MVEPTKKAPEIEKFKDSTNISGFMRVTSIEKSQRLIPGWQLRKLTKTGGTRSLSVGTILPPDWKAVKVFVVSIKDGVCVLKLEQIK